MKRIIGVLACAWVSPAFAQLIPGRVQSSRVHNFSRGISASAISSTAYAARRLLGHTNRVE
jgi:hypothetical protein